MISIINFWKIKESAFCFVIFQMVFINEKKKYFTLETTILNIGINIHYRIGEDGKS